MLVDIPLKELLALAVAGAVVGGLIGYIRGLKRGKDAAVEELLAQRWTLPSGDDDEPDAA